MSGNAYICLDCGERFEEPEVWEEERGEFWGVPAHEKMGGCPHCHSTDYEEKEEEIEEEDEEYVNIII